ncbi:MAG: hypothetical protein QM486_01280 [Flavobacteriaceae bacterium]
MKYLKYSLLLIFILLSTVSFSQNNTGALTFVTAVKQNGPVAYRDPIGLISPDGKLLATTNNNTLAVQPIGGGAKTNLKKQSAFILSVTWLPDSKHLATYQIGTNSHFWYVYNIETQEMKELWPDKQFLKLKYFIGTYFQNIKIPKSSVRDLTWSKDGQQVAGILNYNHQKYFVVFNADGTKGTAYTHFDNLESLTYNSKHYNFAGIITKNGIRKIDLDLKNQNDTSLDINAYGRMAFSPNGTLLYYSKANAKGVLDLWQRNLTTQKEQKLTSFSRDSYAPSVSDNGKVLFKLQDYRTFIATASGDGGSTIPLTTFQSEIPYWSPDGTRVSFTFGTWRRKVDDAHYPHISQDLGMVYFKESRLADKPDKIIRASYSEDQGMSWSPNEKWITFHTHADGTDDTWLQPANDTSKGRPITTGGYESGWPRWSPNGKWIINNTATHGNRNGKLVLIGISQKTGKITKPQQFLIPKGLKKGSVTDAQWTADSQHLIIEYVIDQNTKALYKIPLNGDKGTQIYTFKSNQMYSGIGFSKDQQWVAFIAPDKSNNYQVYKVSVNGKTVKQLTFDATDKAHPVFSPTENRIAFSVFSYQVIFWLL